MLIESGGMRIFRTQRRCQVKIVWEPLLWNKFLPMPRNLHHTKNRGTFSCPSLLKPHWLHCSDWLSVMSLWRRNLQQSSNKHQTHSFLQKLTRQICYPINWLLLLVAMTSLRLAFLLVLVWMSKIKLVRDIRIHIHNVRDSWDHGKMESEALLRLQLSLELGSWSQESLTKKMYLSGVQL